MTKTTADLIAEYNALIARRYDGGHADGGYPKRTARINRICDELANRADRDDTEALAWLES